MWRDLSVILVGLGLLFPLSSAVDAHRPEPLELVETLPPQQLIPLLAFGHRETAADILEIRITNFLVRHMIRFSRLDRDQLWLVYGAIMALDPDNVDACWRGSVYMSSVADRPDSGIHMLLLSLGETDPEFPLPKGSHRTPANPKHPRRWLLYHELAAIHFLMLRQRATTREEELHETRRAGELWLLAAEQVNAPRWFTDVGRTLTQRGWSQRQAYEHEIKLWTNRSQVGDPLQRERAKRRLLEAKCGLVREILQERVAKLRKAGTPVERLGDIPGLKTRQPRTLADLDPLGVGYLLHGSGEVVAPAFEAAKMERKLESVYDQFKAAHPDATPTPADLKADELPDFLELQIGPKGYEIKGRIP